MKKGGEVTQRESLGRRENEGGERGRKLELERRLTLGAQNLVCTLSPLHTNFHAVNFQRCITCSHAQPCELAQGSGVHCHTCASSTRGCAFVYFTVLHRVQ